MVNSKNNIKNAQKFLIYYINQINTLKNDNLRTYQKNQKAFFERHIPFGLVKTFLSQTKYEMINIISARFPIMPT